MVISIGNHIRGLACLLQCHMKDISTVNLATTKPQQNTTNHKTMCNNYSDIIMSAMASQITSITIVYSTVYSGADQRKHQSSASLAFVWGIHCWPVNAPHKWPITRQMFPFDDVIMNSWHLLCFGDNGTIILRVHWKTPLKYLSASYLFSFDIKKSILAICFPSKSWLQSNQNELEVCMTVIRNSIVG